MSKPKITNFDRETYVGAFPAIHSAIGLDRVVSGAKLNLFRRRSLIIESSCAAG
jgi:hypothetical protein